MYSRVPSVVLLVLCCLLIFSPGTAVCALPREKPKEQQLETALLQQLYPVIRSSLQDIFREEYPSFACERIVSINEQATMAEDQDPDRSRPVDAMHGGTYFQITVSLCKGGRTIELRLKNDTPTAQYYVDVFHVR